MRLFLYLTLIGMGFAAPAIERLQDQVAQLQQKVAKLETEKNAEKPEICE